MNTVVYWFSGSGNSWLIASSLVPGAPLVEMRKGVKPVDAGREIFVFPVFAFGAPSAVASFIRRLPKRSGVEASVIATMGGGGYEGRALRHIGGILRSRGRAVVVTEALEMPEAFVQAYPATEPVHAEELTQKALKRASELAPLIGSGTGYTRPDKPGARLALTLVSWLFGLGGRRFLGLSWSVDPKSCTQCGLCARHCPAATIRMKGGYPRWGASCSACQRCANLCPARAIRVSPLKLVAWVALFFIPYASLAHRACNAMGVAFPGGLLGSLAGLLAWLTGTFVASAGLLWLLRILEAVPALRRLFALSYATNFRLRLAQGFLRNKE